MARLGEPLSISALDEQRIAMIIQINLLEDQRKNTVQITELKLQVSELNAKITDLRKAARSRETRKPAG